jgi:hypothetical protein
VLLPGPPGTGLRAAVLSDGGTGAVTVTRSGGTGIGPRTSVLAAIVPPAGGPGQERVSPADLDADTSFDGAGLAADPAGDLAVGWERYDAGDLLFGRRVAQVGVRRSGGAFGMPVTLTPAAATEHATGDAAVVAIDAGGELLATWADHYPNQVRLNARWFGADGTTIATLLDTALVAEAVLPGSPPPTRPRGHHADVLVQVGVTPSRRGRIPVSMSCVSFDGRACRGSLTLTYGAQKRRAGRAHFTIRAGRPRHVYVTLTQRSRRTLRRRQRLEMLATAVTAKPNGAIARSSEEVFLRAPARR